MDTEPNCPTCDGSGWRIIVDDGPDTPTERFLILSRCFHGGEGVVNTALGITEDE